MRLYLELSLVKELNLINSMLAISNSEKAKELLEKLEYDTSEPIDTVLDRLSSIRTLFNVKDFDLASYEITSLVDLMNRKIFSFKCDKTWYSLERTIHKNIRYCQFCDKNVYQIENEFDLKKHLKANDCIYFLGDVDTPKSCQITETGKEVIINFDPNETRLMGAPEPTIRV